MRSFPERSPVSEQASEQAIEPDADTVLASKGRSFHWARRLLGKEHAVRATRLYRFCRYIDDVVDEEASVEQARIMLHEVQESIATGHSRHEILIDGLRLMDECHISKAVVLDLIDGVGSDMDVVRIEDEDALLRYCYQVAGTVGLMMCKVLDSQDEAATPFAIDLGIAMQLTNICRDIKTDACIDRRYIPTNWVHESEPAGLISPNVAQQVWIRSAVARLLDCAETYYQSGERGLSYLPFRARVSILVAARVYREIGRQLKKKNYTYWESRMIVSTPRKCLVTLRALFDVILDSKFWQTPKQHDSNLHRALQNIQPFNTRSTPRNASPS
jgi:15-cis-phytoene synthase